MPTRRLHHTAPQSATEPEPPLDAPQRVRPPIPPPAGNPPLPPMVPSGSGLTPEASPAPEGSPLGRFGRRLLNALGGYAAGEARDLTELAARIQQPLTAPRRIAVTSVRGGAAQATVTLLAAAALARFRHDRVLVIDAHPSDGGVCSRLGIDAASALGRLAHDAAAPSSIDEVEEHLVRSGSFWVLPADDAAMLDLGEYRAAIARLTRFFAVTLINCPTAPSAFVHGVLDDAHTIPLAADAVHVPYDEHLAASDTFDASQISDTTHAAAIRLAAEAVTRAIGPR